MAVQSVNSGNGIYVDNTNPQQPIVINQGVIQLSLFGAYDDRGISLNTPSIGYPELTISSVPYGNYQFEFSQYAIANNTPKQLALNTFDEVSNGAWAKVGSAFHLNQLGLYSFDYVLAFDNNQPAPLDGAAAIKLDGSYVAWATRAINLNQGINLLNLNFQYYKNDYNVHIVELDWMVGSAANVFLNAFPTNFGTTAPSAALTLRKIM